MKLLIWITLFLLPGASFADQYLCVADLATGFIYDKGSKQWVITKFNTDDSKFVVAPSQEGEQFMYSVSRIGSDYFLFSCENGFSTGGYLQCSTGGGTFEMNGIHGRYTRTSSWGYFTEYLGVDIGSPLVEIGKCSKF